MTTPTQARQWQDDAMELSHQVMSQTEKLQAVEAQRDELLAACKAMLADIRNPRRYTAQISAAIARAEGSAALRSSEQRPLAGRE